MQRQSISVGRKAIRDLKYLNSLIKDEVIKEKKISKEKPHMILEPHSYLLVNECL